MAGVIMNSQHKVSTCTSVCSHSQLFGEKKLFGINWKGLEEGHGRMNMIRMHHIQIRNLKLKNIKGRK